MSHRTIIDRGTAGPRDASGDAVVQMFMALEAWADGEPTGQWSVSRQRGGLFRCDLHWLKPITSCSVLKVASTPMVAVVMALEEYIKSTEPTP